MASVETLLAALHARTQEFVARQRTSTSCRLDVWALVARNSTRVLDLVDGPTDLQPILREIVTASSEWTAEGESPLSRVALTIGVLADTLDSRPDLVRTASLTDRSQLRFSILASLHSAAGASSRAAALHQHPSATALLRDLADSTEAASHVPLRPLQGGLSILAIAPAPGGLDEAISRWASVAIEILSSPNRATKYAFQRTAVGIARLCGAAAEEISSGGPEDMRTSALQRALVRASQSWQRAAAWPPELRLDGRSTELRQAAQALDAAISLRMSARGFTYSIGELWAGLPRAMEVASVLEVALSRRVSTGGVWIVAEALGPAYMTRHPGTHRNDWLPDPGSRLVSGLLQVVQEAGLDLRGAVTSTQPRFCNDDAANRAAPLSLWEQVTCPDHYRNESRSRSLPRTRAVGPA